MSATSPTHRSSWSRRDDDLARRDSELRERAAALLHPAPPEDADLHDLTAACAAALRSVPGPAAAGLCALAADLQQLAGERAAQQVAGRARRLASCEQGLARLRTVTRSAELIDRVCEEVNRACGFGRTLLSRVDAGRGEWQPWMLHERTAPFQWFDDWADQVIPLDELTLESELLRECRPALIDDLTVPGVHPMVHSGRSNSYVVAPIMPAGRIIGFFHCDHHPTDRRCVADDRTVLWAFTQGFGQLYERTALLERLRTQREQVRETLAGVDSTMQQLAEAEVELAVQGESDTPVMRTAFSVLKGMSGSLEDLTPREVEVLELIVRGATNQEIAAELVISLGTVKSHVKHILAKLGAVNRSQAIAHYLGVADDWSD